MNQLWIRGLVYPLLLIVGKIGQGMRSCKCTVTDTHHTGGCQLNVSVTMTSVCQ
jgi:hypothetical protein